jgi:hypothetical protein
MSDKFCSQGHEVWKGNGLCERCNQPAVGENVPAAEEKVEVDVLDEKIEILKVEDFVAPPPPNEEVKPEE